MTQTPPTRIVLSVCTFRRNDGLRDLLASFAHSAQALSGGERLGVVVVDDSPEGGARSVVDEFASVFDLGVAYVASGAQNIATARNLGLDASIERADWILLTDDDCVVDAHWVERLRDMQLRTTADAVTGPLRCRPPDDAPDWIVSQPFLESDYPSHGEPAPLAATHNSMLSVEWLRRNPTIRFRDALGTTGGEDAVFFRTARSAGLTIRFAADAVVTESTPASRVSYRYQLRRFFWHGNSSYVTATLAGLAGPNRMFVAGLNEARRGAWRPFTRLLARRPPQWRYALAVVFHGAGTAAGRLGMRVEHR